MKIQNIQVIKIASCSFTDWPLLEKIAIAGKQVIASCAGTGIEDIRKVVNFMQHRNINLSLMHCVAEYPTETEHLQLNQIDYLKKHFPIRLAIAKGAKIFEKHIGVETDTVKLNGYSANPIQVKRWLQAAHDTYKMCGISDERYLPTQKEINDLQALKRGVFAKKEMKAGDIVSCDNTFYAFPCQEGQIVTSDITKYSEICLKDTMEAKEPILKNNVIYNDSSKKIQDMVYDVLNILKRSGAIIPENSLCSLSHHYGIDRYKEIGVAMIECINREYCKKILVVLAGQHHPSHYHLKKEETFTILWGQLDIEIDGTQKTSNVGEQVLVERGKSHSFSSKNGCVFEEISTTHYKDDSYYDSTGFVEPRKTNVYLTSDLISSLGD